MWNEIREEIPSYSDVVQCLLSMPEALGSIHIDQTWFYMPCNPRTQEVVGESVVQG